MCPDVCPPSCTVPAGAAWGLMLEAAELSRDEGVSVMTKPLAVSKSPSPWALSTWAAPRKSQASEATC
jgi:hypothetical protein